MARRVIARKVRKGAPRKNVLSVRPFGNALRTKIKTSLASIEKRRQSKVTLTPEEKSLLKATLEPLRTKRTASSKLKPGIETGRVIILLTGPYKGRRAVVLKALSSGLLLITGPHLINGLPLRRVHQKLVIVTSTKLDLSSVTVPEHIDDEYFARPAKERKASTVNADGQSIFTPRKTPYVLTEQRKADQITIDQQICQVLKKHPERQFLVPYLASHFFLKNRQYPHLMKF